MILDQEVVIYINSSNREYFIKKGYPCGKNGSKISVNVRDLKTYSRAVIKIKCDLCGTIFERQFNVYTRSKRENIVDIDCCRKCAPKKIKIVFQEKYGVDNISQLPEIQEKIKENNLAKYGVEHTSSLDSVKQKCHDTYLSKYGVLHSSALDEMKQRRKLTCLQRYGTEYAISSPIIRKKIKKTLNERYGVDNPSQIDTVMAKIINSKYHNGSQTSSHQQNLLNQYIKGELNYPFKRFYIDIAFPHEKIAVEYIGGGHDLSVKMGRLEEWEFVRNENFRRKSLFLADWTLIEFVSLKNKMLDEGTAINVYNYCKHLIYDCNKHYIKVYIDEDKIMSGNDKICYKYTLNDWNEKTSLGNEDGTVCTTV